MFKHQDKQMFGPQFNKISHFHIFEVVCRGSVTELKVGKNSIFITERERR